MGRWAGGCSSRERASRRSAIYKYEICCQSKRNSDENVKRRRERAKLQMKIKMTASGRTSAGAGSESEGEMEAGDVEETRTRFGRFVDRGRTSSTHRKAQLVKAFCRWRRLLRKSARWPENTSGLKSPRGRNTHSSESSGVGAVSKRSIGDRATAPKLAEDWRSTF